MTKIHISKDNRENIKGQVNGKAFEFQPDQTVEVDDDVLSALRGSYVKFDIVGPEITATAEEAPPPASESFEPPLTGEEEDKPEVSPAAPAETQ